MAKEKIKRVPKETINAMREAIRKSKWIRECLAGVIISCNVSLDAQTLKRNEKWVERIKEVNQSLGEIVSLMVEIRED